MKAGLTRVPESAVTTNEGAEHEVLLGLGANRGDPPAQLAAALRALAPAVRIDAVSSLYRSAPVGFAGQPDFYNAVALGRTELQPRPLLQALQRVEAELGRRRTFPGAPRVIDLDLLAHGGCVMRTAALTLPHPRLHLRGFVLHPLAEVAPEWRHPVMGKTARELLSAAGPLERVERLGVLPGFPRPGPLAPAPPAG